MTNPNPNQNMCSICNKSFNSPQELQEHQRNTHGTGRKEGDPPASDQSRGQDKIAS
jgi:hypothetical protein